MCRVAIVTGRYCDWGAIVSGILLCGDACVGALERYYVGALLCRERYCVWELLCVGAIVAGRYCIGWLLCLGRYCVWGAIVWGRLCGGACVGALMWALVSGHLCLGAIRWGFYCVRDDIVLGALLCQGRYCVG